MMHLSECNTDAQKLEFLKEVLKEDFSFPSEVAPNNENTYQTAIVLLAALIEGPHIEGLTRLTGYPRELITDIFFRAKAAGLWLEHHVDYEHWFEGDDLVHPLRFWVDVLVAQGLLIRQRRDDGEFVYQAVRLP